jgi:hypothetical protein
MAGGFTFHTDIVCGHINRVELRQRPFRLFGDNGDQTFSEFKGSTS